ncbi:MAG: hypothetical protein KAU50_12765 [Candidatus Marinimicrobia bacterium]|nr:hypothetical protein [Candidatus Neomarinimicrobiota bacterium]
MNRNQKIALIIGSIIIAVLIITAPQYQIIEGIKWPADYVENIKNQYDLGAAAIRGMAALVVVVAMIIVLRSKE